jgi:N-acetylglutamate synthase/N-acetylornithine aminotransferase
VDAEAPEAVAATAVASVDVGPRTEAVEVVSVAAAAAAMDHHEEAVTVAATGVVGAALDTARTSPRKPRFLRSLQSQSLVRRPCVRWVGLRSSLVWHAVGFDG